MPFELFVALRFLREGRAQTALILGGTTVGVENGQTVTVGILDSSGNVKDAYVTTVTNNTWSVNVTSAQATALVDGSYAVTASVADVAGNPATTTVRPRFPRDSAPFVTRVTNGAPRAS